MGVFMEIRCEGRGLGLSGDERCLSDDNADAMTVTVETVLGVSRALAQLKKESLDAGWVLHKGKLYCPACAREKVWEKA